MKKPIILYLLLLPFSIFSQELNFEELKERLKSESDREKIETYLDISEIGLPMDSNLHYLNLALETAEKIHFDSIFAIESAISMSYYMGGDYESAKSSIRKSLDHIQYTTYTRARIGHVHMLLGAYCEALNQPDSAFQYYNFTIRLLETDTTWRGYSILSSTYQNKANIYLKGGDYEEALTMYFKSMEIDEHNYGNYFNQVIGFNNIAGCYQEMGEYEKSIEYYEEAKSVAKEHDDIINEASVTLGLADSYYMLGKVKKAKKYFLESKEVLEPAGFKEVLNIAYQHLAEIYFDEEDFNNAAEYAEKAVDGAYSIGDYYVLSDLYLTQARIHKNRQRFSDALVSIDSSYTMAREYGYLNVQKDAVVEYIDVYGLVGDYEHKAMWYDTLLILRDSILNGEHLHAIEAAEKKYQSEKKEKIILEEKVKNAELREGKQKAENQVLIISLVALLITGFFVTLYFVLRKQSRQKREELYRRQWDLLMDQNMQLEEGKRQVREHLSIELHNGIKADINTIHSGLESSLKEGDEGMKYVQMLPVVSKKLRDLSHELAQTQSQLNYHLSEYIHNFVEESSLPLRPILFHLDEVVKTIPFSEKATVELYNIVREGIENSRAHGQPTQIDVSLKKEGELLILQIQDNGGGFSAKPTEGFGLRSIKRTVKSLKGTFSIKSTKNSRTSLVVSVPCVNLTT